MRSVQKVHARVNEHDRCVKTVHALMVGRNVDSGDNYILAEEQYKGDGAHTRQINSRMRCVLHVHAYW